METIYKEESFPGNHPVRVLKNNIIDNFETVRDGSLARISKAVHQMKVKPGIKICISKEPLRTPFVECDEKTIHIDENYLAYLWAMCYSLFVIYEEGVQKRIVSGRSMGFIHYNNSLLRNAKNLFEWTLTLKEQYSDWDLSLPNPERHNDNTEKWYAEKVNGIFIDVVTYWLYHEFAHLVNDHCSALQNILRKKPEELSDSELAYLKQVESEADTYAFDSIIAISDSEQYKLHKGLALVLAHCSNLFAVKEPTSVKQFKHPDLDNRILSSIENLNLQDNSSADYIWYLGAVCCYLFFEYHSITIPTQPIVNSAQELFFKLLKIFDEIKLDA